MAKKRKKIKILTKSVLKGLPFVHVPILVLALVLSSVDTGIMLSAPKAHPPLAETIDALRPMAVKNARQSPFTDEQEAELVRVIARFKLMLIEDPIKARRYQRQAVDGLPFLVSQPPSESMPRLEALQTEIGRHIGEFRKEVIEAKRIFYYGYEKLSQAKTRHYGFELICKALTGFLSCATMAKQFWRDVAIPELEQIYPEGPPDWHRAFREHLEILALFHTFSEEMEFVSLLLEMNGMLTQETSLAAIKNSGSILSQSKAYLASIKSLSNSVDRLMHRWGLISGKVMRLKELVYMIYGYFLDKGIILFEHNGDSVLEVANLLSNRSQSYPTGTTIQELIDSLEMVRSEAEAIKDFLERRVIIGFKDIYPEGPPSKSSEIKEVIIFYEVYAIYSLTEAFVFSQVQSIRSQVGSITQNVSKEEIRQLVELISRTNILLGQLESLAKQLMAWGIDEEYMERIMTLLNFRVDRTAPREGDLLPLPSFLQSYTEEPLPEGPIPVESLFRRAKTIHVDFEVRVSTLTAIDIAA